MKILKFSLGQLQANCYLLYQDNSCIVIDPADDAPFLLEEIQRRNLTLLGLCATHGHFDHVMAAGEMQLSFNVPLYIHQKDRFLITRLGKTAQYFLGYEPVMVPPKNIKLFSEKEEQNGGFEYTIIPTPGHTPGSVSYYFPDENIIFTGDTLFKGSVGRTDLSYSNAQDLHTSVRTICSLPPETIIYPGHGEETSVDEEARLYRF